MPLGKISKAQIAKGFEALENIEQALQNKESSRLAELSSAFYTVIPHSFGRQCPPTINTAETLRLKMDMLTVSVPVCVFNSLLCVA
jgi:poly [ADP-ribose] polymerase 2/3/4